METSRLGRGETIASVSAVLLFLIMFIFDWFGVSSTIRSDVVSVDFSAGANAWQSFDVIDLILLLTILVTIGVAIASAMAASDSMPVAGSTLVAGLGLLSVVLIVYRIIDPPSNLGREIGVWLGLIAAAGIAYGGWVGMQEEGAASGGGGQPPSAI